MLGAMARSTGKKNKKVVKETAKESTGAKGRPRTVRLTHDDELWVSEQAHPQGFSGVLGEAVRHYRAYKDETRKALLGAVS